MTSAGRLMLAGFLQVMQSSIYALGHVKEYFPDRKSLVFVVGIHFVSPWYGPSRLTGRKTSGISLSLVLHWYVIKQSLIVANINKCALNWKHEWSTKITIGLLFFNTLYRVSLINTASSCSDSISQLHLYFSSSPIDWNLTLVCVCFFTRNKRSKPTEMSRIKKNVKQFYVCKWRNASFVHMPCNIKSGIMWQRLTPWRNRVPIEFEVCDDASFSSSFTTRFSSLYFLFVWRNVVWVLSSGYLCVFDQC